MLRFLSPKITTERLTIRMPEHRDFAEWQTLRDQSAGFLLEWEPIREPEYLSAKSFRNRIKWGRRAYRENRGLPLLIFARENGCIVGGINIDNIQQGVAQSCTIGYWMGQPFVRQGYMGEALPAVVNFIFDKMDVSRVQAGTLPENRPSRALLEKSGFQEEGVGRAYLKIAGEWRDHILYAINRADRTDPKR